MHAVRIHALGGVEQLRYEDIPLPEPGPNEVRIKLEAIGVNFIDIYYRTGLYKAALPLILGREGAGTVGAVGNEVTEFRVGDRVAFADEPNAYAEFVVQPAERVVRIPNGVATDLAAAVILQGMTAQYLATDTYPIKAGDWALVHAGASGAGQLLVQVCKLLGANVIATVSTEEKAQVAREAGADEVILYSQVEFAPRVRELTGGRGVDVVYDSVGKDTCAGSLDSLRRRGMLVLWGNASGAPPPIDPLTLLAKGSLFMTRPRLRDYVADHAELNMRASQVFEWVRQGKLRVRIDRVLPLQEAAAAHRHLESRSAKGKVLLLP